MSQAERDAVLDAVLVPRRGLTVVAVQDELILYDRRGQGTLHRLDPPAALVWRLLDGTATVRQTAGEIAEAVGADPGQVVRDIAALVSNLAELDLVVPAGGPRRSSRTSRSADDAPDDDREEDPAGEPLGGVLPMRRTPCYRALEAKGWHATDAISAAPFVVGVRTSDEAARQAVRARFGSLLSPETDVDPNFSLRPAVEAAPGQVAQLAQLFAGCTLVGRHRTTEAAVSQLARELQATSARAAVDQPWFEGSVLVVGGWAALAPARLWPSLTVLASRLRDRGVGLLGRHVILDLEVGDVVVPALDPSLREGLGENPDAGVDRRYPLAVWLLPGQPHGYPLPPAQAVSVAAGMVLSAERFGLDRLLPPLSAFAERGGLVSCPIEPHAAVDLACAAAAAASS